MSKSLRLAGLVLAFPLSALAEPPACSSSSCPLAVSFASVSETRSYGLLITAPETGCRHVRFRVEGEGRFLGQTPPLAPGELAVVRLGRGFPKGHNQVLVAPIGCNRPPAAAWRVILAKIAPDHGWRASQVLESR
jgi:hypothetical protein